MVACQKSWMERPEFVAAVREEYLNERSHYRETGIKQTRYKRVCMYIVWSSASVHFPFNMRFVIRASLSRETQLPTLLWTATVNTGGLMWI